MLLQVTLAKRSTSCRCQLPRQSTIAASEDGAKEALFMNAVSSFIAPVTWASIMILEENQGAKALIEAP